MLDNKLRWEKGREESKCFMWCENEATGVRDHKRGQSEKEEAEDKKKV